MRNVPSLPGISALILLFAVLSAPADAQWRSALYPADWKPGFRDAQGRFLHDFSYAGYRRGEKPIPTSIRGPRVDVTKAPYNADSTGRNDATAAIQSAIDSVGRSGGGVVYLPTGTYRLRYANSRRSDTALWVHDNGVVVRGDGPDKTRLFLDERVTRGKQLLRFSPTDGGHWYSQRGSSIRLSRDLPNQAKVVPVPDPNAFTVGEWVVLRIDASSAWIAEHGMTGRWTSGIGGVVFYREIVAISASARTVTLDAPIRYPMKVRDNLRIYRVRDPLEETGLEDLAVGMRQHPGTRFGDSDYTVPGTGAYEVHASDCIKFEHARNSWIQRVHSYRPTVNTQNIHLHSDGIALNYARHMTVKDCCMSFPQYEGGGGNGYGYVLQGADCLFVDDSAEHTRHNFSFKSTRTTGNVILRASSKDARLPLDFHMHLSMANLIDGAVLDRDYIHASYRTSGTVEHGYSTTQSVMWNTTGVRYGRRSYIIDSRQYGNGYVIGTQGAAAAVVTTPTTVSGRSTAPVDWLEGRGQGATLEPKSLYEDQLRRRLSVVADYTEFGSGCSGARILALAGGRPLIGATFQALITKPNGAGVTVGILGFAKIPPIDLTAFGMTGCTSYVRMDVPMSVRPFHSEADIWLLPVPNDKRLLGSRLYQQGLILAPRSNSVGLILTNGGDALLGEL